MSSDVRVTHDYNSKETEVVGQHEPHISENWIKVFRNAKLLSCSCSVMSTNTGDVTACKETEKEKRF